MANPTALKLLIFGGNGVLGTAIANKFKAEGYEVTFGVRKVTNSADQFQLPLTDEPVPELLKGQLFDSVVFAQGANNNDSVINYSSDDLNRLFEANVTFISQTTKALILHNLVKHKGKMVILSSFWEALGIHFGHLFVIFLSFGVPEWETGSRSMFLVIQGWKWC